MIYNLAGCLQQANSFFLDDCVDDIVSSWTPLIQIFNGDLLSIRILEIRSAFNHLEPDGIYESVIFPFTQAYLKDYYGKDIFSIFPRGEYFKIMAGRNILALFRVDGYMERAGVGP